MSLNIDQSGPRHVLAALAAHPPGTIFTTDDVAAAVVLAHGSVPSILALLVRERLAERVVRGRYRITDAGRAHLSELSR
ncbi:hypothetical protein [Tsukamurella tyrosinosolvens]|uniref:hypothetical protein n=1 Tax=Tsukamurella tyrosinosolvens TaxID=57704 RepID=UPI001146BE87|nr:hypothetical protein [Tsukamurella tyrosinosolvens]